VIKTGIRRLSLSYSRISLRDICVKLHLDSEEDAEYIVGKAIRDGVIDGRVVHEKGWMECGANKGAYGPEVADVFARRIAYCLELHNESVKVRAASCIIASRHMLTLIEGDALPAQCAPQGARGRGRRPRARERVGEGDRFRGFGR
jgi:hypothetical protein